MYHGLLVDCVYILKSNTYRDKFSKITIFSKIDKPYIDINFELHRKNDAIRSCLPSVFGFTPVSSMPCPRSHKEGPKLKWFVGIIEEVWPFVGWLCTWSLWFFLGFCDSLISKF